MSEFTKTLLTNANLALRCGRFSEAVVLYENMLSSDDNIISNQIRFNLEIARRRAGLRFATITAGLLKTRLEPVHQIELNSREMNSFISKGSDPFFTVHMEDHRIFTAGWYLITLKLMTSRKRNIATIYPDYGGGFTEESSIKIAWRSGVLTKQVYKMEADAKHLRFDPLDLEGGFEVQSFTLESLTDQQAKHEMKSLLEAEYKKPSEKDNGSESTAEIYSKYKTILNPDSSQINYQQWIEDIEQPSLPSGQQVAGELEKMILKPLISVVMPTYNTDAIFLHACIDSVIAQSYPNWELCIADDASPNPHVRQILQTYAAQDARIKTVFRDKNGHISHASNSALKLAKGDFVALLDHDDALPEHALLFVAKAINAQPDSQVIYSDEDKISGDGRRFDPHFKSDWNPDLFYSQNYVSHLGVYKRSLLEKIGGFRPGLEGSQDQDLLLRCLPHIKSTQIVHIPLVLYHWRAVEGSTALAGSQKTYTTDAGIKALTDYFANANPAVRIHQGLVPNTYRVSWPIPDPAPLVSLLIPTRDRRDLVEVAVRSILEKSTYRHYEILILDNGSVEPDTLAFFAQIQREDQRVRVLRYDHPFNYSAINNFGVRHAKGDIIGLVNNDIEVISPEWLTEMVSHVVRPDVGCVGAKLYYENDTIQHAGVICSLGGVAGHSHKHYPRNHPGYFHRLKVVQNISAVTAACLLIRKTVYEQVGELDEDHLRVAFNDVDFCLKVRTAGYRNLWTPYAELYHYESISRGHEDTPEKQKRFQYEVETMKKRWGIVLDSDPYYSINLTRDREDFTI